MKKVLYFYPDNPVIKNSGNRTRALSLLEYFKSRKFEVDLIGLKDWSEEWDSTSINFLLDSNLTNDIYVFYQKPPKENRIKYFFSYKISHLLNNKNGVLLNLASPQLKYQFNELLKKNNYDYIIISYAHWATLIKNNPLIEKAKTIIDTHDFLTSQYQTNKHFKLGASFEEEIKRLQLFEEIWAISTDEAYIFSQFCDNEKVKLIPIMAENHTCNDLLADKTYDVIYVASDNPHNIKSAKWFFKQVYPLLSQKIKICVVGKIVEYIDDYINVVKIPFASTLDDYYRESKIAICPMLTGTGTKVKVVEALSYSLPIACTTRGVDGLTNKANNGCLVSDQPDGFADNILSLLNDPMLYQQQSKLAKELFNSSFSIEACYKNLDRIFELV